MKQHRLLDFATVQAHTHLRRRTRLEIRQDRVLRAHPASGAQFAPPHIGIRDPEIDRDIGGRVVRDAHGGNDAARVELYRQQPPEAGDDIKIHFCQPPIGFQSVREFPQIHPPFRLRGEQEKNPYKALRRRSVFIPFIWTAPVGFPYQIPRPELIQSRILFQVMVGETTLVRGGTGVFFPAILFRLTDAFRSHQQGGNHQWNDGGTVHTDSQENPRS
ncbi:MAG: hypothetical protein JXA20_06645 [Spirochaetes bacterium]|nr:hypothetical protein [Spirochaetota bacterium]